MSGVNLSNFDTIQRILFPSYTHNTIHKVSPLTKIFNLTQTFPLLIMRIGPMKGLKTFSPQRRRLSHHNLYQIHAEYNFMLSDTALILLWPNIVCTQEHNYKTHHLHNILTHNPTVFKHRKSTDIPILMQGNTHKTTGTERIEGKL